MRKSKSSKDQPTKKRAMRGAKVRYAQNMPAAFGALRNQMADHLYSLTGGRHIYTSPWVFEGPLKRCDASIGVTVSGRPFNITVAKQTHVLSAGAIRPMVERVLEANDVGIIGFQFDPSNPFYPRFRRIAPPGIMPLDRKLFDRFNDQMMAAYRGTISIPEATKLFDAVTETAMKFLPRSKPIDKRVAKVIDLLWERFDYPLAELSAQVGLSSFRLSHLFAENMGITLRHYLQWRKIRKAISLAKNKNMNLSQIAVASGFTDAAHFSKAFVQLHAAPPSYFFHSGNVKIVGPRT